MKENKRMNKLGKKWSVHSSHSIQLGNEYLRYLYFLPITGTFCAPQQKVLNPRWSPKPKRWACCFRRHLQGMTDLPWELFSDSPVEKTSESLGTSYDRKACMDCLAGQTDQEMASSNTNQLTNNVILTEDDIPGAKIPRESLEYCRIWRMCPAKQSMHALRSQFSPGSRSFCHWMVNIMSQRYHITISSLKLYSNFQKQIPKTSHPLPKIIYLIHVPKILDPVLEDPHYFYSKLISINTRNSSLVLARNSNMPMRYNDLDHALAREPRGKKPRVYILNLYLWTELTGWCRKPSFDVVYKVRGQRDWT